MFNILFIVTVPWIFTRRR